MTDASPYDTYTYPTTSPDSGSGHPGHTTPEQDAKVVQFREELKKEGVTERLDTHTLVCLLLYLPVALPHQDVAGASLMMWLLT